MESDLEKQVRVMAIIAAAFMASVLVYAAIAVLLARQAPAEPSTMAPALFPALLGVGAASAAAGFLVRRFLLERPGPRDVKRYFTAFIVGLALFEAPAIYGLIATFLSHDVKWAAIACVLSLACMALTFPRRDAVDLYLASR